jgi:type I restriction enzyme S subunit
VDWSWEFSIFVSIALIRPKKDLNNLYLKYILESEIVWWQIKLRSKQGTVTNLHLEEIRDLEIPIPTADKQIFISQVIATCDTVIEQTQAAIEKYKAIKQGMLHDLFTRGLTASGQLRPTPQQAPELYKQSELGLIPKEWEVKRLEECTSYVDYRGKTPPKSDKGIVLVTAKNIRFGYIDYELSKEFIPEYAFESAMSRGKANLGDVLITTEAPMGNIAQIDKEDIALAQRVIKYQGTKGILSNDYLKLALMSDSFQRLLSSEATGSTALGIKGSRLHKLKILIPTLSEQNKISEKIKSVDTKLQSEEALLSKYQSIKKGLMSDLLSGKREV